ncbi:MAG: TolC family protein [Bacteroidota bacterium]
MKKIFLTLSVWYSASVTIAQVTPPPYSPQDSYEDLSVEEKLVWLTWNTRADKKVLNSELAIANKEIGVARWSWSDNLRASFNLNEFTIRDDFEPGEGFPFFPRYNLGLTLTFGDLISNPAQIRIAQEQKSIVQARMNDAQLDLRTEVLEAYQNYLLAVSLYQIGTEQNEEAYTNFLLISEKFKTGEETLVNYNSAQQLYTASQAEVIKLESQVAIARLRIERYIGIPLEEVLAEEE